ncbi:MAG: hypothetical protein ISR84_00315 [Kiritimatiellales bacterium]|nr:hypothetical protein [Kiritimatiellota bacterium]MBL7015979.1 hypothetical protein [Kiritimatiellales bacterium]
MRVKTKNIKHIILWIFALIMYVRALIFSYTEDRQLMFCFLLAQIPLFLICWGLNTLLSGKDIRDISKNLTPLEREESIRLAASYGSKIGIFLAAPCAIISGCLYAFGIRTILPYALLFCLFMIILTPVIILQRRKMKAFMYSTDYAKKSASF